MAQGLEAQAAEQWIFGVLSGDSTLSGLVTGVYVDAPPENVVFPFVVFQEMSGADLMVVGAARVWTNLLYLVKVVGQTQSYGDLKLAVARVDVLLHRGSGTAVDGTVWACVREQPFRMAELDQGVSYRSSGGIYRLYAS